MKDLTNYEVQGGAGISLWGVYVNIILWKINEASSLKNETFNDNIYLSINIDLCMFMESIINEVNRELISYFGRHDNSFTSRLIEQLESKQSKAQWRDSVDIFKLVTNHKVNDLVKPSDSRIVNTLFSMRNLLVHGGQFDWNDYQDKNGQIITFGEEKLQPILESYRESGFLVKNNNIDTDDLFNYFNIKQQLECVIRYICSMLTKTPMSIKYWYYMELYSCFEESKFKINQLKLPNAFNRKTWLSQKGKIGLRKAGVIDI